jgi:hypothetical protein
MNSDPSDDVERCFHIKEWQLEASVNQNYDAADRVHRRMGYDGSKCGSKDQIS